MLSSQSNALIVLLFKHHALANGISPEREMDNSHFMDSLSCWVMSFELDFEWVGKRLIRSVAIWMCKLALLSYVPISI